MGIPHDAALVRYAIRHKLIDDFEAGRPLAPCIACCPPTHLRTVAPYVRVRTVFMGDTNDGDPPEEPKFVHFIYEPGTLFRTADSYGYDYAIARHERIAEWLRKRNELRRQRAGHK